jgi:6,7-dimethyl-8-ribityllumazine synthase
LRFAIVVSRFNELISSRLLDGAKDALLRHDVRHQDVDVFWVPGAWEIPLVVKEIALTGKYDGIVALGAVIRGDTPHFDYVSAETSKGIASVGLEHRVPVAFGVLTCDNLEQALIRAGSKAGNKGAEAALTALEMARLLEQIRKDRGEGEE